MDYILAPSILSADFKELGKEMKKTEEGGAKYLHFDVMDGMFCSQHFLLGSRCWRLFAAQQSRVMDVHLMIREPIRYVEDFKKAGADIITVHLEACEDVHATLGKIRGRRTALRTVHLSGDRCGGTGAIPGGD